MRSWQRALAVAEAQMRAEFYRALIECARVPSAVARYHTERASIEQMKIYLTQNGRN